MPRKLVMLVGIPGSGKSTYLDGILNAPTYNDLKDAVVLSTDRFLENEAEKTGETYNTVFKENIKLAEMQMAADMKAAIHAGKDIVWDQTNLTAKVRKNKMAQIPAHYERIAIVFSADPVILNQVNEERAKFGRAIPDHILTSMEQNFEMPTKEEGFSQVIIINR